jgi:SAM-dependent methyltransferase
MNNWADGYVSDIEYLDGWYAEQMPAHLDIACLLRATEPPVEAGEPFFYCELGCGTGKSAATVAATCPHAEVWGIDFNPAHIARARRLSNKGELDNLHLEDWAFADLAGAHGAALPRFHYIALHGVWSWISSENQRHIVDFIDAHLEPGGLVYITYNALPGWNNVAPMQRVIRSLAMREDGRSDDRAARVLGIVRRMADAGAGALLTEQLSRLEEMSRKEDVAYVAHEYLNEHWQPCYQMDVAEALASARLTFAASANILDNYPDVCLTKEQRELIDGSPLDLQETVGDFFRERTFRRDIFIRGARTIPARRLESRLRSVRLTAIIPTSALSREIKVPAGAATLGEAFYGPALEQIAGGTPTLEEIFTHVDPATSTATAREAIGMLVGSKQALPVVTANPSEAARIRARRYNSAQIRLRSDQGKAYASLAGMAIGSAVTIRLVEMLVYTALADGIPAEVGPVVDDCWNQLQRGGDHLAKDGKIIEDRAETVTLLEHNVPEVLSVALPMWRRVGAI